MCRWLNVEAEKESPALLFSDAQDCMLVSLAEGEDDEGMPWRDAGIRGVDIYGEREGSPLSLVPADEKKRGKFSFGQVEDFMDEGSTGFSEGVDDTFHFKNR